MFTCDDCKEVNGGILMGSGGSGGAYTPSTPTIYRCVGNCHRDFKLVPINSNVEEILDNIFHDIPPINKGDGND